VILAELIGNVANASAAVGGMGWTSTKPEALRAAWDTYGGQLLLPWNKAHDVGAVASAYNRVDDIAWLAVNDHIAENQDYQHQLDDIWTGIYVVGRVAGYSELELAGRGVPLDRVVPSANSKPCECPSVTSSLWPRPLVTGQG
jgi:hypothetical protein